MALRKIAIIPGLQTKVINYGHYRMREIQNNDRPRNSKNKFARNQYHAIATLPVRDATKYRRTTDDISRTRPDERTRFTITMSPFHGHTPTSATRFGGARWWGPGGGGGNGTRRKE